MSEDTVRALARALDHSLARTAGIEMASDAQLLIDALAAEGLYVIDRAKLESMKHEEPWPQFGYIGTAIDVRNGWNGAIDTILAELEETQEGLTSS